MTVLGGPYLVPHAVCDGPGSRWPWVSDSLGGYYCKSLLCLKTEETFGFAFSFWQTAGVLPSLQHLPCSICIHRLLDEIVSPKGVSDSGQRKRISEDQRQASDTLCSSRFRAMPRAGNHKLPAFFSKNILVRTEGDCFLKCFDRLCTLHKAQAAQSSNKEDLYVTAVINISAVSNRT